MLLKRFVLAALLMCAGVSLASTTSGTTWELRTTGNDANGGCFGSDVPSAGTDYSQQDAAQVAFTDLVIGTTNTQLTSAANPFTAAYVGNCVHVTGGTGFTTGWYQVTSVSGVTATMDRAVGTASSTGGTGNLGGGFASFGAWITAMNSAGNANGNKLWIKAGTYTQTATQDFQFGGGNSLVFFEGYQTTHGDHGTRPLFTSSTLTGNMFNCRQAMQWYNVNFSNTNASSGPAFYAIDSHCSLVGYYLSLTGFNRAFHGNFAIDWTFGTLVLDNVEISNSRSDAIWDNHGATLLITNSYIHNNGGHAINTNGSTASGTYAIITGNVFVNNTGECFSANSSASYFGTVIIQRNTCANNTVGGFDFSGYGAVSTQTIFFNVNNNVIYGNGGWGLIGLSFFSSPSSSQSYYNSTTYNNAFGANTSGAISTWFPNVRGTITLTANPFTNSAGGDYTLNSTAGGGALLKATAYPTAIGSMTNKLDVGSLQTNVGGGGSTAANSSYAH